jgi:pilus assembly protein CpaF
MTEPALSVICPCCGLRQLAAALCQLCWTSFEPRDLEVTLLQRHSADADECIATDDSLDRINRVRHELVEEVLSSADSQDTDAMKVDHIREVCDGAGSLTESERRILIQSTIDDICGLGPLGQLMRDSSVDEVYVNSPDSISVNVRTPIHLSFRDEDHLRKVVVGLFTKLGHDLTATRTAMVQLPNGWIVEATLPPISSDGTILFLEKTKAPLMPPSMLVSRKVMSESMLKLLKQYISWDHNIVISGSVGSGRTAVLNSLLSHYPDNRRVIVIDREPDFVLSGPNRIRFRIREGYPSSSASDLVQKALSMKADNLVLTECKGAEALELFEATTAGHSAITTVESSSPKQCLRRLERMVRLADPALSVQTAREILADGVQVIVQITRLVDATRRIMEISELHGLKEGEFILRPIFSTRMDEGVDSRNFLKTTFHKVGNSRFDGPSSDVRLMWGMGNCSSAQ